MMKMPGRLPPGTPPTVILVLALLVAEQTASGQECQTSAWTGCSYSVNEEWGSGCVGQESYTCIRVELGDWGSCDSCDGYGDCVYVWASEPFDPPQPCGLDEEGHPLPDQGCEGNMCASMDPPCPAGCRPEDCNGSDDDGDGIIDNGNDCGDDGDGGGDGGGGDDPPPPPGDDCPQNDPECDCSDESANTHLTSGVMALSPQVDVELEGPGRVSARLVRYYASQYSNRHALNSFGRGFTSTLNERLEGDLATPAGVVWVRPGGTGVGHAACTQQGAEYDCVPQVNRHHTLRRLSDQTWRLTELGGTVTTFDSQGRLTGKHDGTTGWGYTLTSDGSGHVLSLTDSAGRTLVFVHDSTYEFLTGRDHITRVELQRSPTNIVLADYGYSVGRLVSVTRPTGTRTYEYFPSTVRGITAVRENSGLTTLETHEFDASGRAVESRTAYDASGFRHDVTCNAGGPPGVLLFDLTAPETDAGSPKACTSDAQCSGGAACHVDGYCYWYSCLEYDPDHMDAVTSITGNCECSGTAQSSWTSGMRLAWRTDRDGVRTTYEYDSNGLEIARCENDSDTTVTRADPNSCPAGGRWEGTWYSATWPGKPTERRRKSALSPSGNAQVLYSYDSYGRLDIETHNGYTRNGSDTVVSYSYVTNWDFDSLGRLTRVDGPISGASDRVDYTYFASGNGDSSYLLQRVRRYTSATAYLDTTYAAHDPYGHATQVTGPNGTTTTYTFDMYGRVLTETTASLATSYSYDDGGRLEQVTYPRGNVLLYRYDEWGRLSQIAKRDNPSLTDEDRVEMTHDDAGRLLTRSTLRQGEAAWLLVKQAYDISGRLWRVYNPTDPTDNTYRELGYDSVGNVVSDRDESQNLVQSFYDSFNRLTEVRRHLDGSGSNYMSTTYGYGLFGEPTSLTDGEGHQTTYERDDLLRLTKVVSPDAGTIRYVYDEASRVVDRYAADGKRSHFVYDGAGRLTWADHDYGSVSAFTSDMRFTFDSATGCPTDKPQNASGRLARADEQLFADSSLGDGVYDRIVCYYYDSLGRLVRETTLGDEGVTRHTEYELDSNSNLVRLRYPMITNAYARWDYDLASGDNTDADDAYRVASETTKGVTYIYAAKASERYPFGPLRRIWHGNATSTPPSSPSREVLRRVDGTVSTLRTRLGGSTSFDVIDRTYGYQPTAQIASFSDALAGNPDRYYKYDAARRLTCATKSYYSTCPTETSSSLLANVTYDNADNRETFREYSGVSDGYVYTAGTDKLDRINHVSQTTDYTNDGSGRRTYDNNLSISDDYRNYYYRADGRLRLVSGRRPSVNPSYQSYQLAYAYDWKGRRIFKSDKNLSTGVTHQWWFYYDASDRLIGIREIPNAATPTTYDVHVIYYLADERVMRFVLKWVNGSFSQEQRDLFHNDHLATPMELERWPTTGSPSIVWSADYDPWGYANVTGGSTAVVDHRFPGQWYDTETESRVWQSGVDTLLRPGLAQNWWREYDAMLGTYGSVEPLFMRGHPIGPHGLFGVSLAPFGYSAHNPADAADPDGQRPRWPSWFEWGRPNPFDWLLAYGSLRNWIRETDSDVRAWLVPSGDGPDSCIVDRIISVEAGGELGSRTGRCGDIVGMCIVYRCTDGTEERWLLSIQQFMLDAFNQDASKAVGAEPIRGAIRDGC